MRRVLALLAAVGVALPVLPAAAAPSSGPAHVPVVGECYDLSDAQVSADYWTDAEPVPCTQRHTYEVTEAALIPMDVNAITFARAQCGPLDVWTAVGVNSSSAGVIEDPIRIEPRSFYARPDRYVCGAAAVEYQGREDPAVVALTSSIELLRPRTRESLRHCSDAADGRSAFAPPITVPCSSRPRWQAVSWILWSALYDDNPGRAALKERAAELCGPDAVYSLPGRSSWPDGVPRTWCYLKYP
jgi:hypothetical protein